MTKKIYLDYAAATPLDPGVLNVMRPYFSEAFYNPSADYALAREVKHALTEARAKVAYWLGAQANEIIFTAGGTEANNLAIAGVMQQYPSANLLISSIEHESVRQPAANYSFKEIPVNPDGRIDLQKTKALISDETVLISVMYANNEIGTIQPLHKLSSLITQVRGDRRRRGIDLPLILHSDACQAANYLDLHVSRLGVDLMTLNGGKIYGPKQSGALYVSRSVALKPLILGGGQERNLRSGTENVAANIGFAHALELAQKMREDEVSRLNEVSRYFMERLSDIPGAKINGSSDYRLPNNVHVTIAAQDNEYLLIALDQKGIMAAAGSACSAAKEEASHVLDALGLSEQMARSSLRFSLGRTTVKADIDYVISALKELTAN